MIKTITLLTLTALTLMAGTIENPDINCTITKEVEHQPVGDETGKFVLSSKKVYRQCTQSYQVQGQCEKWERSTDEFQIDKFGKIATVEVEHSGSLTEALTTLGAINQATHMFNGAKAYCEEGWTKDFDWLEDPMMWASILLDMSGAGAFGQPEDGSVTKALTSGYGQCLAGAGLDVLSAAVELSKDEPECDPVDEFCGPEGESAGDDPGLIQTLTLHEFNTMVTEIPEIIDQIEMIDDGGGSGYVVFRYLEPAELIDVDGLNEEQIQEARETAKLKQFQTRVAVANVKLAACAGQEAMGDISKMIAEEGAKTALGAVVGPVAGAFTVPWTTIAMLAWNTFNSFDEIDSCHDEGDSESKGTRHVMAYTGLRFDTCHPVRLDIVVDKWPATGDPMLYGNTYCCFDSPMSRIIMAQMKAQVGKGWTHCTGLTLNELSHMSWRQCTDAEMESAPDGTTFQGTEGVDYDMKESYQYIHQCMDMSEMREYVESQIPVDFDQTHVSEMLERLNDKWKE